MRMIIVLQFIKFCTKQVVFGKDDEMVTQIGSYRSEQTELRWLIAHASIMGTPDSRGKTLFV